MSSVNKVILVGNLGADPEVRRMPNGNPVVNLRLATSEKWRDKNTGEQRERTEWHRVVIFSEGLAKIAEQYLRKGSKVFIEGQLQTRKWQDQSGQERYSTEIVLQGFHAQLVMLSYADGDQPRQPSGQQAGNGYPGQNYGGAHGQQGQQKPAANTKQWDDMGGDEIPF